MAQQTLVQRIALTGGADIKAQLDALGADGEAAFKKLQEAASQFKGPDGSAVSSLGKIQAGLTAVGKAFEAAGEQLKTVGKNISLYVTAPLTAIGTLAVKNFTDFDSAIAQVSVHIDTTRESITAISQAILEIGKNTPVGLTDLATGFDEIRAAGISAADGMNVLKGAAQLAVASQTSVATASKIAASAITDFNLQGSDQAKVFDLLFRAADAGRISITDLDGIFGKLGQTTQGTKIQLDEYLAALSTLTASGLSAGSAQKELTTIISNLAKGTTAAQAVFKQLGVSGFDALVAKSGGLIGALSAIVTATKGNDAELTKAFGSATNYAAVLDLLKNHAAATTITLAGMRSGVDAVGGAFSKVDADASSTFQKIQNSSTAASINVGADLTPVVEKIGQALATIGNQFAALPTGIRQTIEVVAAAVALLGPVLLAAGLAMIAFGAILASPLLIPALTILGGLILSLTAAFVILAPVVKTLGDAFKFLTFDQQTTQVHAAITALDDLKNAVQAVKDGVPGATDALAKLADGEGKAALAAAQAATRTLQATVATKQALLDAANANLAAGTGGQGAVNNAANALRTANDQLAEQLTKTTQLSIELNGAVASSLGAVTTSANTANNAISTVGKATASTTVTILRGFGQGSNSVGGFSKQIVNLGKVVSDHGDLWVSAFKKVNTSIAGTLTPITGLKDQIAATASGITKVTDGTGQVLADVKTSATGVGAAIGQVASSVKDLGDTSDALAKAANITGVADAANQVVLALKAAGDEAQTVADGIVAAAGEASKGWAAVPQAISDAAAAAQTGVATLIAAFQGVGDAIGAAFASVGPAVTAAFAGVVDNISSQLDLVRAATAAFVADVQSQLAALEASIAAAQAAASGAQAVEGHAAGGPIGGPGTGTSDSILARVSRGEFIIKARAVSHYGAGLFAALNNMRLPRELPGFSMGGLASAIGSALGPSRLPAFAAGGSVGGGRPINLSIDGKTFGLVAPDDTADSLSRFVMSKRVRSSGTRPGWYR